MSADWQSMAELPELAQAMAAEMRVQAFAAPSFRHPPRQLVGHSSGAKGRHVPQKWDE